jgi:uncharacterized NAD-dependent epimerase/dehydratase family protein
MIDIVLIDSGVNRGHPALKNEEISGLNLLDPENPRDIDDKVGHGTAIYYLLRRYAPKAHIFPIKIFDDSFSTTYEYLIQALEYVYENLECKVIHLSNGVTYCDDIEYFHSLCIKIKEKGIILISAFDNGGTISYPAAFPEVIGVDWSSSCKRFSDYEYLENSPVNIRGIGTEIRVPWLEDQYILAGGSSFVAPYITGQVYGLIEKEVTNLEDICSQLKQKSKKQYQFEEIQDIKKSFPIKRAVIFPYNKEIHSLLRYSDLLSFQIHKLYDVRYLGNTGKRIAELTEQSIPSDLVVQDLDKLDWESEEFDCFVLGHSKMLGQTLERDFISEMIEKCLAYGKNLYCFDDLSPYEKECSKFREAGLSVYYPSVTEKNIPKSHCGKLRHMGKPVIGIFGTSSKQGKYTLQLALRRHLLRDGYRLGQLGTEPTAPLFGFDACYPVGYASTVKISGLEGISTINYLMGQIEDRNPDIIMVGGQSQTISLTTGNIGLYTLYNQELLLGSEPDICILCVNIFDEIEYIKRTVRFLESFIETKVIALVLYPVERNLRWSVFGNTSNSISEERLLLKQEELKELTGLPVYILNSATDIEGLYHKCIDFFAEEN